jgi:DNA-directed RNA polymerase specialized sigma24 family protein
VIYGYTRREISKIIGKPQGTVASKLYRSYVKLRKLMAEK